LQRELEIQEKETEIETANLSIRNIQLKILEKQQEIKNLKNNLKLALQKINQYDKKSSLEIIFLNGSISEVLNHVRYLNTLQKELGKVVANKIRK